MSIVRRVPWTRKPPNGTPLDWGNPLTARLMAAIQSDGVDVAINRPPTSITGTRLAPAYSGLMRGFGATYGVGSTDAILTANTAVAPAGQTTLAVYQCNGAGGGGFGRLFQKGANTSYSHLLGVGGAGLWMARYVTAGAVSQNVSIPRGTDGVPHVIIYTSDGLVGGAPPASGVAGYLDGVLQTLSTGSSSGVSGQDAAPYYVGNRSDAARAWDGWIGLVLVWARVLVPAEIEALSKNPWQVYEPRKVLIGVPSAGAGTGDIAASGGAVAGGSAALSVSYTLAAVGLAVAGGSGTLSVAVPLAAVGLDVAGGSAGAVANVTIAASALAQAGGSAGMSVTVTLAASGGAVAGGSADISASSGGSIAASGGAVAGGSALMSATVQISAAGYAQAMGAGALAVAIPLAAFGHGVAGGSAALSTDLAGGATGFAGLSRAIGGSAAVSHGLIGSRSGARNGRRIGA